MIEGKFIVIPAIDGGEFIAREDAIDSIGSRVQGLQVTYSIALSNGDGQMAVIMISEDTYKQFRNMLLKTNDQ